MSCKHKVLLVGLTNDVGGVERNMLDISQSLIRSGVDVCAAFPESEAMPALKEWFVGAGVPVHFAPVVRLAADNTPYGPREAASFRQYLYESRADVVNLHYGGSHASLKDVLSVRSAGRKRCIITLHHAVAIEDAHNRRMTRLASHLSHAIVVGTPAMHSILCEAGVPARKIKIIPYAVTIPSKLPSREATRTRLELDREDFVVAILGRMVAYKGHADLIKALSLMPRSRHRIRLIIAGDGSERPHLEKLAEERIPGQVRFLGRVSDIHEVYAAADVFALPSYEEGFGLVYLEAAIHGVPSIGYHVGGVPSAVANNKTGLLVPPGDIAALTSALQTLRDNPDMRSRLGQAARQNVHTHHTTSQMAEAYTKVFQVCDFRQAST